MFKFVETVQNLYQKSAIFKNMKNGLIDPKKVLIEDLQCQICPFLSKLFSFFRSILDMGATLKNGRQNRDMT